MRPAEVHHPLPAVLMTLLPAPGTLDTCHPHADLGVEKSVSVQGDNPAAITSKLEQLLKSKQ